jgi:hypothetical protein
LRSVSSLSRPVLPDAHLFDEQVYIEVKAIEYHFPNYLAQLLALTSYAVPIVQAQLFTSQRIRETALACRVVIDAANAVPIKKAQPAFMIVGFLAPRQSHLPGFRIKPDF